MCSAIQACSIKAKVVARDRASARVPKAKERCMPSYTGSSWEKTMVTRYMITTMT
jgi:hypothetical protein